MQTLTDTKLEILRRDIARRDVIFLMDVVDERHTVAFGKKLVGQAMQADEAVSNYLIITYRPHSGDFKALLDLVAEVKGYHEFYGEYAGRPSGDIFAAVNRKTGFSDCVSPLPVNRRFSREFAIFSHEGSLGGLGC